jgi:large subunit ribosomal protein L22
MEVIAKARFVRMAPRKVRLVAGLVRGLDLAKAEAQLRFLKKDAATPVLKLIRSAAANAQHNFKLEPSTLFVKTITVDGGPVMDRWRARAFGRAAPIRKRTSHITVILGERGLGTESAAKAAVVTPGKGSAGAKTDQKKTSSAKKAAKKPSAKASSAKGSGKSAAKKK